MAVTMDEMLTEGLNDLIDRTSVLDVLLTLAAVLEARNYSAEATMVAEAAEL